MKNILEREIIKLLKSVGFETASAQSLKLLVSVYEDRICAFLRAIGSKSILAGRSASTLTDFMPSLESKLISHLDSSKIGLLAAYSLNKPFIKGKFEFSKLMKLFDLSVYESDIYDTEDEPENKEWNSPLSNKIERAIHIYDFMPNFPPTHTFRFTALKQPIVKNLSTKVKNRLEQSLKSENSMIKLIKNSEKMPTFINFLYKKTKE